MLLSQIRVLKHPHVATKPQHLQYIHMFLSPKLKHLQAAVFFWDDRHNVWDVPRILYVLSSRFPNIRYLEWKSVGLESRVIVVIN